MHNQSSIKASFMELSELSTDDRIEVEACTIMFRFLSVVEYQMKKKSISIQELAIETDLPFLYLLKAWQGNECLTFQDLAKIQTALGIKFRIS